MKFDPQTFFIGVIDFFSVLMPGAVITSLLKANVEPMLFGPIFPKYNSELEGWAVFLFSSYLLGHFIFLLGSRLDDSYDRIRKATEANEKQRPQNGKRPPTGLEKWLARKMFKKNRDLTVEHLVKIKARYVPDVVNAFQWSKAMLILHNPAAFMEVERLEADSKFFRSFVIVLSAVTVLVPVMKGEAGKSIWPVAMLSFVLMCISFWRYAERRFKATQQAYWYVITLDSCATLKSTNENSKS